MIIMKISSIQQQKMLVDLEEFFSVIPRLDQHHKVSISFPDRTVQEQTSLRVCIKTPHTEKLEMLSLHDYQIKEVKKITGLKVKSVNAFVHANESTHFVAMFE